MILLHIKNLTKTFGKGATSVKAVNNVSLKVEEGEIVLIMGPSGSGKTTLLSMIGALLTPSAGTITINGKNITKLSEKKRTTIRLKEIGFVFQAFNLLQNLTALENVQIAGEMLQMQTGQAKAKAQKLLKQLHLEHRLSHRPPTLSSGEQQRVSIARALINNPKIILADEPTGNLDSKSGQEVMMLFHNIAKEEKRSVLIVSHDQRIRDIADRTLWIEDGKISNKPLIQGETMRDLVCGMHVDKHRTPFTKTIKGKTYFFCSIDCQKKFTKHAKEYINL